MTDPAHTTTDKTVWVDAEVHLLPPEWCRSDYRPPQAETVMHRVIYDHPERELALPKANAEGLLVEMEAAGIDRAVVMGLPWRRAEACWRNNEYVAEAVKRYPDRLIGVGVLPSPADCDPGDAVGRIKQEYGLVGVKMIPTWHGHRLDDAVFASAFEQMIEHGLVLVPHTDHLFLPRAQTDTAGALYEVARRYPELRILAPHLGGLLCLYGLHEPVNPVLANILFVTSVPTTMRMVSYAIDAIGADRLAFGTDCPFNPSHDQRRVRQAFEALEMTGQQKRAIAGANVLSFLGIEG